MFSPLFLPPKLVPIRARNSFVLIEDWTFNGAVVKRGFITDLDSIPYVPGIFSTFKGYAKASAVLHDWRYFHQTKSRRYADEEFLDVMLNVDKIPQHLATPMFLAVRTGGWGSWRRMRRTYKGMTLDQKLDHRLDQYKKALQGIHW